jgi:hypothetical protein
MAWYGRRNIRSNTWAMQTKTGSSIRWIMQQAFFAVELSAMSDPQRRYRSYLLRVWQEASDDALAWRVSLEDVMTHQHYTFSTVASLIAFLTAQPSNTPAHPWIASAGTSIDTLDDQG